MLLFCRETLALEVCFSIAIEHQRWKCVIQVQWDIRAGSVLFKHNGTSALEVCCSIAVEQQRAALEVGYLIAVEHQRWKWGI